ncbi:MAG: phospholipase, partial [Frankiales bacterium]|nr:phospholipase [Frankiales bacterium]
TKCAGTATVPCTYTISSSGAPNLNGVNPGASTGNTGRGAGALDLTGQNLAQASYVNFLQADGATAAPGLTFKVGDPNDTTPFPGYASSTLTRGNYTFDDTKFTPGQHFIQMVNTVGQKGATVEFWQPKFAASGVSPSAVGAGANTVVVTVTGQGIRQGSRLSIPAKDLDPITPGTQPDLSVGAATVNPDGTSISAPVSIDSGAATGARSVGINGADGGYYTVANAFTVTTPPSLGSLDSSALGQGASYIETISGTGFAAGTTPTTTPTFTVSGTGVTTKTISSTNISAKVLFTVAQDAATGDRSVTVTNPDGGSSTVAPSTTSSPFTVDAGPTIQSLTPASAPAPSTKTITITGLNYDPQSQTSTAKPTVQFSLPPATGQARQNDPTLTVGTITVTKGSNGAPDKISFPLTIAGNAPAGVRDVIVTNTSDQGSVLCAGCFGVDNLAASPATGANTGTKSIALTGPGVVAGSTAKLVRAGDPTIQPAIAGGSTTVSGTTLTAVFDLTDAAPGPYNAVVTTPSGTTLSCTQCFTVTGSTPTITSITPAAGGQGAKNLPVTIAGNNFSRGPVVTITNLLVHNVVWVSRTQITAQVDIPSNATAQADDLKVANADGAASATKTGAFTVTNPPAPTAVSPTSYGQGAQGVKVTVTGKYIVQGAKLDLGPGVTVVGTPTVTQGMAIPVVNPNPDATLVATVNIDQAASAVQRDVIVTNPDGGVGTLAKGFAVNFGPKVTGITPVFLKPGGSGAVKITGSNFSTASGKTAVPTIKGVTLKNVVVASDGMSITADASVDSGTENGPIDVVVTNPTDSGAGSCTGCFFVATPPGPPVQVHTVSVTETTATAGWTAPSDTGGAPITSYVVSAKDPAGKPAGTPSTTGPTATSGTVTGLISGVKYTISVIARNVAGDSTAGTTLTQTTGVPAKGDTILSSSHSPSLTTTGQTVTLSGKLIKSTGAAISGATVELALAPDVGSATFPKVTTSGTGAWSYSFRPVYSYTIKTLYRGDSTNGPTQATTYRMGVSTRVTVTSPSNGVRSSVKSPLVVRGGTSPNKGGSLITLYRFSAGRYIAVQNVRVGSAGTYAFSVNLARGNYTLKVGIGRAQGNFVGYSPAFGVHRV